MSVSMSLRVLLKPTPLTFKQKKSRKLIELEILSKKKTLCLLYFYVEPVFYALHGPPPTP